MTSNRPLTNPQTKGLLVSCRPFSQEKNLAASDLASTPPCALAAGVGWPSARSIRPLQEPEESSQYGMY
jgi:hypothetical protein